MRHKTPLPAPLPPAVTAILAAVALTAVPSVSISRADTATVWLERRAYLMGTDLLVRIEAPSRALALQASERALAAIQAWDDRLSTWREDGEIMRLNRAPAGTPVSLSRELGSALVAAAAWSVRTERAFDPAVGPLIDAWGLRSAGRKPTAAELRTALEATGMGHFRLDPDRGVGTKMIEAAWIDTGGFGKGIALQAARDTLEALGIRNALLNFGGQVLAWGHDASGAPWAVTIAAPAVRDRPAGPVLPIRASGQSVATSGASERWVPLGALPGGRAGHILDPRSGAPVTPWGSVTVVAADPIVADILSTALFVMGPDDAADWARRHPDVGVAVVEGIGTAGRSGRVATAYVLRGSSTAASH